MTRSKFINHYNEVNKQIRVKVNPVEITRSKFVIAGTKMLVSGLESTRRRYLGQGKYKLSQI